MSDEFRSTFPLLVTQEEEGGLLLPLFIKSVCGTEDSEIERNIRRTLSKPYRRFNEFMGCGQGKSISVVGSAPSIAWDYGRLIGDVMAVNQAHDYLVGKGVIPTYGVLWDAGEIMADLMTPRDGVTYLIGSRCDAKTHEKFAPFNPVVWHAMGDEVLPGLLEEHGVMEPMLGGGAQGVTRLMCVATVMGYSDIHLFGCDSSCTDGAHVGDDPLPLNYLEVTCLGKKYRTTPQLTGQVEDFKILAPMLTDKVRLTIHGKGLLPDVAQELGYNVAHSQPLEEHQ